MQPLRIREIRLKLGMTQREFGFFVCVDTATISRWETGKCVPSYIATKSLEKIEESIIRREKRQKKSHESLKLTL